jgi:hypothetical protein
LPFRFARLNINDLAGAFVFRGVRGEISYMPYCVEAVSEVRRENSRLEYLLNFLYRVPAEFPLQGRRA